ncbi:hypothetical protein BCR44DRAFT_1184259 [Catenaria anguillulae PL171]|uniref:Secreted peptide n=1 Tax=Catenaria anguillulae PL171 TaxID=765915 RepID=A0A1Y2H3P6_9FUNG|nr:hypothetical protein BCR44DRAFT_1184259 [Catenaria anguillulae PL171]
MAMFVSFFLCTSCLSLVYLWSFVAPSPASLHFVSPLSSLSLVLLSVMYVHVDPPCFHYSDTATQFSACSFIHILDCT